jgi:hypothetical protein
MDICGLGQMFTWKATLIARSQLACGTSLDQMVSCGCNTNIVSLFSLRLGKFWLQFSYASMALIRYLQG